MAIDLLNPLDRTSPTFRSDVDALFSGGLNNAIAQMNAELQGVHAMQAGGAYSFMYAFDTGTADADPGLGRVRLNTTTQSAATVIRIDLQVAGGTSIASLLDAIGAGTSVLKGAVRIVKALDPTVWMLFDVVAVNSASGYRNLTIVFRAGSAASPFSNNDAVMIFIDRAGDVGAGALELISSTEIGSPASMVNLLNSFNGKNCDKFIVEIQGLKTSASADVKIRVSNNGATAATTGYTASGSNINLGSATNLSWFDVTDVSLSTNSSLTCSIEFKNVNAVAPLMKSISASGIFADSSTPNTFRNLAQQGGYLGERIFGFQLLNGSGLTNFVAGTIRIYGVRI